MNQTRFMWLAVGVVALSVTANVVAQRGLNMRGSAGWGVNSPYGRLYNPSSVETVTGEITAVEAFTPFSRMGQGIHITLKTGTEVIPVHLGPSWFMENQDVDLRLGDVVEVQGSRITFARKPAIIARELVKEDDLLILRDELGYPAWAGWRRAVVPAGRRGPNWRGGGGWGVANPYGRFFDAGTIESMEGTIETVDRIVPLKGMAYGVHLQLKVPDEILAVHLGPGWFVENQDFELIPGQRIQVMGSRVMFDNEPTIIASELRTYNGVLTLRDEVGFPAWNCWRRTDWQDGPREANWIGSPGWEPGSRYMRLFKPDRIEIIKGDVVSVERVAPLRGMSDGIHLTVRTSDGPIPVHLGPAWFVERQPLEIHPNDLILIHGSKIRFNGEPVIIATRIQMGDFILNLRDENGRPAWSGWQKRGLEPLKEQGERGG